MKINFWVYIENLYDGSACARFFNSKEEAEEYAKDHDERFCDDIYPKSLEVNEAGQLIPLCYPKIRKTDEKFNIC